MASVTPVPQLRSAVGFGWLVVALSLLPCQVWAQQEAGATQSEKSSSNAPNQATGNEPEGSPLDRDIFWGHNFTPWQSDVLRLRSHFFHAPSLSGRVTLEDGSSPPEPARLELVCNGEIQPQAMTKEDGSFVFRVHGDQSVQSVVGSADRSHPVNPVGGYGSRLYSSNCELRAALAGYRSSKVHLRRRSGFESPDIGSIVLYPVDKGPQRQLNRLDHVAAWDLYERGRSELLKEKPQAERASRDLEIAVEEDPEFAAAWNLLAEARLQMDDLAQARQALEKAIQAEPSFVTPCVTLSLLELKQGRVAEAASAAERAISIASDLADARYYHGLACAYLGKLNQAKVSFEVLLQSPEAKRFPRTHYVLGVISERSGDPKKAVSHYREYLKLEPDSKAAEIARKQLDQWKTAGPH